MPAKNRTKNVQNQACRHELLDCLVQSRERLTLLACMHLWEKRAILEAALRLLAAEAVAIYVPDVPRLHLCNNKHGNSTLVQAYRD